VKKTSMFVVVVLSMTTALFAQGKTDNNSKTISLCGSIAYGFGMGGQWIDQSVSINGLAVQERSDKYLNYGDGFKLELGGLYKLMENLDGQAVFCYNSGTPSIKAVTQRVNSLVTNIYSADMLGFKVMALPRVKIFDLLDMYTGFGMGLYFASLSWTNSATTYQGNFRTSPALAFCGSIGVNYPVYNDLIVYGEIAIEQMSFTRTSKLDAETGDQTTYEQDSNANNITAPDKIPGSNIAFRVGVKFPIF
jgi:hypothetical protein